MKRNLKQKPKMAKSKRKYTYAAGKRRSATARVRLFRGKEENVVNEQPISKYFPGEVFKSTWMKPFELTETVGKFFVTVKVAGGGKSGQLDATVHGIAKTLNIYKPEKFRAPLKRAGLLTRDPRVRERRKVGTGGKARRKKQSPKR